MSENVVALPGHRIADPEGPVPNVVEVIEDLLADAKAGVVRAVVFAEVRTGGCISHGWAFGPRTDITIGAAILRMTHAYSRHVFERGE